MVITRLLCRLVLLAGVALALPLTAQVQTEVPAVVPGAKPVVMERVKIHGTALEGNLEGDAIDREVFVLSASQLCAREVSAVSGPLCASWLLHWRRTMDSRDPCASDHRRCFRARRKRNDCGSAGFKDDSQRIDVFKLGDHRRFRAVH